MPKISITRKKDWVIRDVSFEIYLDEQRIGNISKGETKAFDVPVGPHKLKIKIGHFGSKDFYYTSFNKESKSFLVTRNWAVRILPPIFITVYVLTRVFIGNKIKNNNWLLILDSLFILIIYWQFYLIGRNNYLKIKEQ
jgi:hypothetical protein